MMNTEIANCKAACNDTQEVQRIINSIIGTEDAQGLNFCQKVELIASVLKQFEQVSIPVTHTFVNGAYIRQIFIPKGTLVTSRYHRYGQIDVMVYGDLSIATSSGTIRMKGPASGISRPGMIRIAYAHEDTLWMDIHETGETNIDALEKSLFSDNYNEVSHIIDNEDFTDLLVEYGFSPEKVRYLSENKDDQTSIPLEDYGLKVDDSAIEGSGLFSTKKITEGQLIAPGRINGMRTQAGRYTNHSITPNAEMVLRDNGDIDLFATRDIDNEEITINYRDALALSGVGAGRRRIACRE